MQSWGKYALTGLLYCALAGHAAAAPPDAKAIRAVFVTTPPDVDGRLDDPAWKDAAVVDDLHMVSPDEYAAPSETSRIYVLYGTDALYFAARFYDSEPGNVTAMVMRQGDMSFGEDGFSVILDPFDHGRNGYIFDINPNGVRSQALYTNVTEENWDWKGIWHGAARRDEQGWTAEIEIPFKTLSFDPANETWGLNFIRWLGRRNEQFGWVSHNRQQNPAHSGRLLGLTGVEHGLGLDIVPGFRAGESTDHASGKRDRFLTPSVDVFYKLTPAMTAALTLNTDFSGTTADARQINLTRFDLFFPEQRQFFLQDADIFTYGAIGDDGPLPFFSRRIGLGESGTALDIDVGAKLTGRMGEFDIGILDIEQQTADDRGTTNLFVGRLARNVLGESSLGVIVTKGNPASSLDNTLVGADFRYLNTRLLTNRTITGAVWYQQSETETLQGNDAAFGVSVELPGKEGWTAELELREVQENYYPALGFVKRTDVHEYEVELGHAWRLTGSWLRSIAANVEFTRVDKLGGGLESQEVDFTVLELENHTADKLKLDYFANRERLVAPFEISEGIIIPPGDYAFGSYCAETMTGEHRALAGELFACDGDFYGGQRLVAGADLTWRPNSHLRIGAAFEWNDIDLPQGDFVTRLAGLQADIAFTATWYWENLVQYDNVSESIGVNSILRWIPEAGREAVLVLNRQLQDVDRNNRFDTSYTELIFKLGYTFRF